VPDQPSEKTVALAREAASLLGKLLINRRDRKAFFRPDHQGNWHWTAVESPFKMDDFVKHLTGSVALGTYMLNTDSTVKFMAIDLDLNKQAKYLKIHPIDEILELEKQGYDWNLDLAEGNLEAALHQPSDPAHHWARIVLMGAVYAVNKAIRESLELPTLCVITGGGAHVIAPLPEPMPASDARSAGIEIVASLPSARQRNDIFFDYGAHNELSIEVFPKQDTLEDKPFGNLIRLPFGWHYEAGIRTYAIDPDRPGTEQWNKISSIGALRYLAQQVGVGS
jgi:hypothetical protein